MKKETERVIQITKQLRKLYPKSRTMLYYKNPFEILVATVLSAQCTDARVNMITPGLFKKYKNAAGFARARQPVLEKEIRSTGFFRNKASQSV